MLSDMFIELSLVLGKGPFCLLFCLPYMLTISQNPVHPLTDCTLFCMQMIYVIDHICMSPSETVKNM